MWTSTWLFYSDYTYLWLGNFKILQFQLHIVLHRKAQDMAGSNLEICSLSLKFKVYQFSKEVFT